MQKHTFNYCPQLKEQEGDVMRINFDVEESEQPVENHLSEGDAETQTVWLAHVVRVKAGSGYGDIVSAIVRLSYSESAVEAIVLNGKDTAEHEAEYAALQAWRTHANEVAKQVLAE